MFFFFLGGGGGGLGFRFFVFDIIFTRKWLFLSSVDHMGATNDNVTESVVLQYQVRQNVSYVMLESFHPPNVPWKEDFTYLPRYCKWKEGSACLTRYCSQRRSRPPVIESRTYTCLTCYSKEVLLT